MDYDACLAIMSFHNATFSLSSYSRHLHLDVSLSDTQPLGHWNLKISGLQLRVEGAGFRVYSLGFRAWGFVKAQTCWHVRVCATCLLVVVVVGGGGGGGSPLDRPRHPGVGLGVKTKVPGEPHLQSIRNFPSPTRPPKKGMGLGFRIIGFRAEGLRFTVEILDFRF